MTEFAPTFDDLNDKAEQAVREHERAFGYKPSPGLLLNVLKAPIDPAEYPALFDSVSGTKASRRVKRTNEQVLGPNYQATDHPPGLAPTVEPTVESVTGTVVQATQRLQEFFGGTVPKSRRDQAEEIARKWNEGDLSYGDLWEMTKDDPSLQARVNRLVSKGVPSSVDPPIPVNVPSLVPLADGTPARDAAKEQEQYRAALDWSFQRYGDLTREDLERQGVYVSKGILRGLEQGGDLIASGVFGANRDNLLARTAYEIGLAGTQMPFGMYAIGLSVGRDAADLVTKGDITPERTWELAKQAVVGTWNDLQNPLEHPGFFLLALSSVAGGAAGVGARIGNTAAKVSAAQGVLGTGKALVSGVVFRPLPGQAVVAGEFVNLTENAALRAVQRLYYGAADRAITRRTGPNGIPYGSNPVSGLVSSTPGVRTLDRARRRFFSFEQTYSRAVHRRMRAEIQDTVFQADRVQRMATGSAKAERTFDRLLQNEGWSRWFYKQPAKSRLGVQKALQVIAGDIDPDPMVAVRLEREYHERFLTDPALAAKTAERYGTDVATIQRNHRAQIMALNEAEKVLSSMDARFQETFQATKGMSDLTGTLRQGLGLDEVDAVDRIARYGAIIRGEPLTEVKDARAWIQAEIDRITTETGEVPPKLTKALTDPRIDTDPEAVLKDNGVPYSPEAIQRDPITLDSFFFSAQRAGKGRIPSNYVGPGTSNPLGIAPPDTRRLIPELHHRFEGGSIEIGDYRIDTSALTSEAYRNTVRTGMTITNWERLWKLSTDTPGPHSFLIRNIDAGDIKPEIRALFKKMDEGTWDEATASYATDPNQQKILSTLFPGRVVNGKVVDLEGKPMALPSGSFRFVDERFVLDTPGQSSNLMAIDRMLSGEGDGLASQVVGTGLQAYNEVSRAMTLYLRTKYALNALSSAALQIIHEGFLAPVNLGHALVSTPRYGADVSRWLDTLAGQGRTQALISSKAPVTVASRKLADAWTQVTDKFFRRAAVIHELRRQGIRSPEEMRAAMLSNDPAMLRKVREASARGKRAMVEFDNLNPFEQAIARHVLFIYPWVRGSAVWSLRFLVDHPIQAEAMYQIGSMKQDEFDALLGEVPEMWKRMGMYLTGEDENGDLTASSTAWLAPTQAWHDMARPWVSLFQGDNPGRAALLESVGPQGTFLARVATSRNQYGREYEGSPIKGAVMEQLGDTAVGALLNKRERLAKQEPLPALDPTQRDTLVTRESAASKYPMTKLESNERIMDAFLNPFFEPTVDKEALNARAWMDVARSDRKAWHDHQMDLIRQGLELQSKVAGEPVPIDVRTSAAFVDEWSWQNSEARRELGPGAVTDREKAMRALPILVDLGVYTSEEAEMRREKIAATADGAEMKRYLATIQDEAGGRALDEWNSRIRGIVQFRDTQTLNGMNEALRRVGGGDYAGMLLSSEADRDEYGRRLDAYMEQYNQLVDGFEDVSLPQEDQDRLKREFRDWLVDQDQPVKINGREFPSFERARWALLSPEQQQDDLVDAAKRTPSNLSGFDRVLLGLPGNPRTFVQAWGAFENQVEADLVAQQDWEPAEKYTRRELEAWNAAEWEKTLPGFKQEWELQSGPQVKWLERLPQFKQSPNAVAWSKLFKAADEWADVVVETRRQLDAGEETSYLIGDVRKDWQTYVRDSLYNALPADLKAEVNDYGGLDWLASWI